MDRQQAESSPRESASDPGPCERLCRASDADADVLKRHGWPKRVHRRRIFRQCLGSGAGFSACSGGQLAVGRPRLVLWNFKGIRYVVRATSDPFVWVWARQPESFPEVSGKRRSRQQAEQAAREAIELWLKKTARPRSEFPTETLPGWFAPDFNVLALRTYEAMQLSFRSIRFDAEQHHRSSASGAIWTVNGIGMLALRLINGHELFPEHPAALPHCA
jgi:hypothetical protein